jgi:V/A-type H+-transporting ATPase subunit C
MSSFSANAILAKARSMYSSHLSKTNYEELLKRRNINDLVTYLKSETVYSRALEAIKEGNVRREQLETILNEDSFQRLSRLMRYASKKEMEFYRLGIEEEELKLIFEKIRLIESPMYATYEFKIPHYLVRYASFDLYGLLTVNSYDDLLKLLYSTSYYDVLLKFKPKDNQKIDTNLLERELKHVYYSSYVDVVKKLFKGQKQKDLLTMIYTMIELSNITKIYRLKKYFNADTQTIKNSIFSEYSRIPTSYMNELIEAKDSSEFLKKLASSPYKLYVDDSEFVYIEYYSEKIKYNLAKRYMRFSTDSSLVFMTYKLVHSIEIDNLKHIIEGLRYGEEPDKIAELLIY